MLWPLWVVLIRQSTDWLRITCCSPSQPSHHAGCPVSISSSRERGLVWPIAFALSPSSPTHILAILLASAMAAKPSWVAASARL